LPGDWDNLQTREERIDWVNKMFAIDRTSELQYVPGKRECTFFEIQTVLNFFGYKKPTPDSPDIPEKFDTTNLGRFNLPVYSAAVYNLDTKFGHAINTILIGDDPTKFEDWYFIEPQNDKPVHQGDISMPETCHVYITGIYKFRKNIPDMFSSYFLMRFDLEKGKEPELFYTSEDLLLERPKPVYVTENKPSVFSLSQNYPNPFNASTTIEYSLKQPEKIVLDIFNIHGQRLETLVNDYQQPGKHSVRWNADNYSSGTYLYQLRAGDKKESKKMILVK